MNACIITFNRDTLVGRKPLEKHLSREAFERIQSAGDVYAIDELPPLGSNQSVELIGDEWKPEVECLTIDDVVICAGCCKLVLACDSWSPGDEPLCSECDTQVTGRKHDPTMPVTMESHRTFFKMVLQEQLQPYVGRLMTKELMEIMNARIGAVLKEFKLEIR